MIRRLAPYLAYSYLTFVKWTNTLRVLNGGRRALMRRRGQRFIYAFWHQRQVFFTTSHRGDGIKIMVSRSQDGDVIAGAMALSRIGAVRGSSTRGAEGAVLDMLRTVKEGFDIGITPDGPKGPAREVKLGAVYLAKKLGIPLLPIANAMTRKLVFRKSWDQFQVPLPFGRAVVRYGRPVWVRAGDDLRAKCRELQEELNRITDRAEEEAAREPGFASRAWVCLLLAAWAALAPLALLLVAVRLIFSGRGEALARAPGELRQRLGDAPRMAASALGQRPVIWLHAASVGEVGAAESLIARVAALNDPPAVAVTCSTAEGRERASRLRGVELSFLAPLDIGPAVRRVLGHLSPYALVIIETELWPALIHAAWSAGVPVAVANGRLSDRSWAAYRAATPFLAPFIGRLDVVAAQSSQDARRFEALGVDPKRVAVCGNMKFDSLHPASDLRQARGLLAALGWESSPLFVAGSTHRDEEEQVLAAFRDGRRRCPGMKLAIAPRHPERAGECLQAAVEAGLKPVGSKSARRGTDVLVLEEMGLLREFYACAAISFVGGTLVPVGGHNLLEPAVDGRPVLFGPYIQAQREGAAALEACGGGLLVRDAAELARRLDELGGEPSRARQLGEMAAQAVRGLQGASEKTFKRLEEVLTF